MKFRCKYEDEEKWYYFEPGDILLQSSSLKDSLTQFIGLKDINDKEIYEGDIVKYDITAIGGTTGIAEVVFCNDLTILPFPGFALFRKGYLYHDEFMSCEIIGNIYENLSLLNNI